MLASSASRGRQRISGSKIRLIHEMHRLFREDNSQWLSPRSSTIQFRYPTSTPPHLTTLYCAEFMREETGRAVTIIKRLMHSLVCPSVVRKSDGEFYSSTHLSRDIKAYADTNCMTDAPLAERKSTRMSQIDFVLTAEDTENRYNVAPRHNIPLHGTATHQRVLDVVLLILPCDTQLLLKEKRIKAAKDRQPTNSSKVSDERLPMPDRSAIELSASKSMHSLCGPVSHLNLQASDATQTQKNVIGSVSMYEVLGSSEQTPEQIKELVLCRAFFIPSLSSSPWNEKNKMQNFVDYAANLGATNPTNDALVGLSSFLKSVVNVIGDELMTDAPVETLKTTRDNICSGNGGAIFVIVPQHSGKTARLRWLEQTNYPRHTALRVKFCFNEPFQLKLNCIISSKREDCIMQQGDSHPVTFFVKSERGDILKAILERVAEKSNGAPGTSTWFVSCIFLPDEPSVCGDSLIAPSKYEVAGQAFPTCVLSQIENHRLSRNADISVDLQGSTMQTFYKSEEHEVATMRSAGSSQNDQSFWKGGLAIDICLDGVITIPEGRMNDGRRATTAEVSCICNGTCTVPHGAIVLREKPFLSMVYLYCNGDKFLCAAKVRNNLYGLSQSEVLTDTHRCFINCPSKLLITPGRPHSLDFCEMLLSESDRKTGDKEQSDSPCDDSTDVLPVKEAYKAQWEELYSGRRGDCSMADAHGFRRLELRADKMSIEVVDEVTSASFAPEDANLVACFDVSHAASRNDEPPKIFDNRDVTSTLICGSCKKSAEPNNDFGKLSNAAEEKVTPIEEKLDFLLEFTRDCKSLNMELCSTGLSPGRRSVDIFAYPVHAIYCASPLLQQVIASHESHAYLDVRRLASFQTWPHLGKLSALRCYFAGFCRTAADGSASAGDDLSCFSCGCAVSNWVPGVDPLALHNDKCGQHCSFIAGIRLRAADATGHTVLCANDHRAQKKSIDAISPSAACSKSSVSVQLNVADWWSLGSVISFSGKSVGAYRHAAAAIAASGSVVVKHPLRGSSLTGVHLSESSTPAADDELAKNESYRLSTFENVWVYGHIVAAEELARNGFLYAGPGDRVKCAFCRGLLRNWEPGDRADEQHAQHFTYCRFVQGHDVGNVPIAFSPLTAKRLNDAKSSPDAADGAGADLGINCAVPSHPDFAVEARRLLTFATWPGGHHMHPEMLAKAGFFYLGNEDAVQCFFCDCTVVDWKIPCDPWVEHAQRCPDCCFVTQVQGREFVRRHNLDNWQQASTSTRTTTRLAVDPREVRARIDLNMVRILLRMDYPLDLVREVIQNRLATVGRDYDTSEQLLDDVFQTHDNKQRANISQNPAGCGTAPAVQPMFVSHQRWEASNNQDQAVSRSTTTTTAVTVAVAASATSGAEARDFMAGKGSLLTGERAPLVAKLRPEEENRQLKTQLTCKVCMDKLVGIVFLPCGHLVCCAECAPALNTCPICRVSIRGTVRTMI